MAEINTQQVRDFLSHMQGQELSLSDIRKELNILPGTRSFDTIRNIIFQLVEAGVISYAGKRGNVKVITQVSHVPVFSVERERRPPFPLIFPRAFDTGEQLDFSGCVTVREGDLILISGLSNFGKGHPDGTPILTPSGWKNVENIKLHDIIFGQDGKPHKVTGVYPRGVQSCYRFIFDDRSYVDVDSDHLWTIRKTWGSGKFNWLTKSVKEIISIYGDFPKHSKTRIEIPMCKPVQFPRQNVPLSPYLVGLLLGDGALTDSTPRFSTGDIELLSAFTSNGFDIGQHPNKYDYSITGISGVITELGIRAKSADKHIPDVYLFNSPDIRLALLRGLMDTDGYVNKHGICEFSSTSPKLIDGVRFIINSLGGRGMTYTKPITSYHYKGESRKGQASYRISFSSDFNPFSLKRKAEMWKPPVKNRNRRIKHIEYIGEQHTTCLSTDAENGLYITKDCIVTHNTTLCLNFLVENLDLHPILMGNEYTTIVEDEYVPSPRFLSRLDAMDWVQWTQDGLDRFTLLPVRDDYAEHIVKDRINIIDWINIDTGEHYLIGSILERIKRKLGRGVAIIAIQKGEGADAGRGGQFTKDFADLELLIDRFGKSDVLMTIGKVKEPSTPITGLQYAYSITHSGTRIMNFREVKKCGSCKGTGYKSGAPCAECDGRKFLDVS